MTVPVATRISKKGKVTGKSLKRTAGEILDKAIASTATSSSKAPKIAILPPPPPPKQVAKNRLPKEPVICVNNLEEDDGSEEEEATTVNVHDEEEVETVSLYPQYKPTEIEINEDIYVGIRRLSFNLPGGRKTPKQWYLRFKKRSNKPGKKFYDLSYPISKFYEIQRALVELEEAMDPTSKK